MCKCTSNCRTPFCEKPGCDWPNQQDNIKLTVKEDICIDDSDLEIVLMLEQSMLLGKNDEAKN